MADQNRDFGQGGSQSGKSQPGGQQNPGQGGSEKGKDWNKDSQGNQQPPRNVPPQGGQNPGGHNR